MIAKKMLAGKKGVDWSLGEALAFASLLNEDHPVRLAGQDVCRGTFSHRHAVFFDKENSAPYSTLSHLHLGQGEFEIINSPLSEYAAMGFEFGQAMANPNKLVCWEAQFGDFANGAQIIIDQFLSSSAAKWKRFCGLVLLLPHGYEGQGPEHSSARLERFLQLCAQRNMQVMNVTTLLQYFHALRRQLKRDYRLPLVMMTPKSLLRHPMAVSAIADFSKTRFQEIIDDEQMQKNKVRRVVLCSGKVYYELLQGREDKKVDDVAILRLEQIYPMHRTRLLELLATYPNAKEVFWVQEEPQNMGAWTFINQRSAVSFTQRASLALCGAGGSSFSSGMAMPVFTKNSRQRLYPRV